VTKPDTLSGMSAMMRAEAKAKRAIAAAASAAARAAAGGRFDVAKSRKAMAAELESAILSTRVKAIAEANRVSAREFGGEALAITADERQRARAIAKGWAADWAKRVASGEAATAAAKAMRGRLETIAITENAHAYSKARGHSIAKVDGVVHLRWDATLDKRTCHKCRGLDGEKLTVRAGVHPVWPGGYVPGQVHPRCRCYAEVVSVERGQAVPPPAPTKVPVVGARADAKAHAAVAGARPAAAIERAFSVRSRAEKLRPEQLVLPKAEVSAKALAKVGKGPVRVLKRGDDYFVVKGYEARAAAQAATGTIKAKVVDAPTSRKPRPVAGGPKAEVDGIRKAAASGDGIKVRTAIRDSLASQGIVSRDWFDAARGADAYTADAGEGYAGLHTPNDWGGDEAGKVQAQPATLRRAAKAAAAISEGRAPARREEDALITLLHEELHGTSPGSSTAYGSSYKTLGARFEEASTELLARRSLRRLRGTRVTHDDMDLAGLPHPDVTSLRAGPVDTRHYETEVAMVLRSTRARGIPDERVERALVAMRGEANLDVRHETEDAHVQDFAGRLGLSAAEARGLVVELRGAADALTRHGY